MDRAYLSNVSGTPPLAPPVPALGFPQAGNPSTSQKPTRPGAYWYYMITESLRNIIIAAGLDPDHEDLGLLVEATGKMFLGKAVGDWLRDNSDLERFNFQAAGTTSYKGHGATAHAFLDDAGAVIARMLKGGKLTLPNLALAPGDDSDAVPNTGWVQDLLALVLDGYAAKAGAAAQTFQAADGASAKQVVNISQFGRSFGANGYQRLPNGLILQWGVSGTTSGGPNGVTFPIAFPNAAMAILTSITGSGSVSANQYSILTNGASSPTGFNANSGPGSSISFFWFALGY